MKRIYLTFGLLGALATGVFAQQTRNIDLEAVIGSPIDGATFQGGQNVDTNSVLCGILYLGTDIIYSSDDYLAYMTSFSRPPLDTLPDGSTKYNDSLTYVDGVIFADNITNADSGKYLYLFPNEKELGAGHVAPFTLSTDSIRGLYDWDAYHNLDSIVLIRPPYVDGKEYGFFFRALGIADQNGSGSFKVLNTDATPDNNRAVQRIIWKAGNPNGINELVAKKDKAEITVYPNPATSVLNFKFKFASPDHASAIVRDITGRMVAGKNFGRALPGTQTYTIDISNLSAGNYTLEFNTDLKTAVTKFTVKK